MATDERLSDVVAFTRAHLAAEAALAIAALGEPDDDAYLALERDAKTFYAAAETPLGPIEARAASPGGRSPNASIDVSGSVGPAPVYAIGTDGPDAWIVLVGDKRDLRGTALGEAVLVRRTAEGLRIAGRASADPFTAGITFEHEGGEPFDPEAAQQVEVLQEPTSPASAAFVLAWGRS